MSFYLEEDDLLGTPSKTTNTTTTQQSTIKQEQNDGGEGPDLVCPNCGSKSFYKEKNSGAMVCNACFTQSQTQNIDYEEMDVFDNQEMAVKDRYGNFMGTDNRPRSGGGGGERRGPLVVDSDFDRSRPLPGLVRCCFAFQFLLKKGAERAADLAGLLEDHSKEKQQEEGRRRVMLESVRQIWFGYITSWMEGAEKYSKLYPELRFSLRDAFLPDYLKSSILRHLSAVATEKVKKEKDAKKAQKEAEERAKIKQEDGADDLYSTADIKQEDDASSEGGGSSSSRSKRSGNESDSDSSSGGSSSSSSSGSSRSSASSGSSSSSDDNSDSDSDDNDTSNIYKSQKIQNKFSKGKYRRNFSNIIKMLDSLPQKRRDDGSIIMERDHAALRIKLSMTTMAAIIHLALLRLRAGIASFHISAWIANGALPQLMVGFQYLPKEVQEELPHLRSFFMCRMVPQPTDIDFETDLLAIASGIGLERPRVPLAEVRMFGRMALDKKTKRRVVPGLFSKDYGKKRRKRNIDGDVSSEDAVGNHFYCDNVPLLTARLVQDLGLGQRVLDITYALMGVYNPEKGNVPTKLWLPAPLPGAKIENMVSPVHIMAVVAVACKMCSGWENWVYKMPEYRSYEKTKDDDEDNHHGHTIKLEENSEDDEDKSREPPKQSGKGSSNRTISSSSNSSSRASNNASQKSSVSTKVAEGAPEGRQRFVPWDENQFRLLGNGPLLDEYLDYVNEMYLSDQKIKAPYEEVISSFKKDICAGSTHSKVDSSNSTLAVRPNVILAGAPNPNKPKKVRRKDETLHWDIRLGSRSAIYSDANGIGEYVIYSDMGTHANRLFDKRSFSSITSEPFHPHYGALIEYMSYKIDAEPSELHYLVAHLDEEVAALARPKPKVRTYREKRKRPRSSKKNAFKWDSIAPAIVDSKRNKLWVSSND